MKLLIKYLLLVLILVTSNSVKAQNYPDFSDTLHIGYRDQFYNVFVSDSCYIAVGEDTMLYFAKFDFQGNLIETKITSLDIDHDSYHHYSDVKLFDDKFVIFATKHLPNNLENGYIAVLNNQFDTLWTKTYTHATIPEQTFAGNVFSDIQQTPDGGFIVAGYSHAYGQNYNYVLGYLLKIDSLGNKQWFKQYPDLNYINKIQLTPDLGIILYASEYGSQYIIKTNALGTILWKKYIKRRLIFGGIFDLKYAGGNDFVLVRSHAFGDSTDVYSLNPGVNLIKINYLTGNFVFDTIYHPFEEFPHYGNLNLRILSDGKIIVFGIAYTKESGELPVFEDYCSTGGIVIYSSNGDSLTYHTIEIGPLYRRNNYLTDLAITPDGGFVGCGKHVTWTTTSKNDVYTSEWIFKFTPSWATEISHPKAAEGNVTIYPNPASNHFNLSLQKKSKEELQLKVYNTLGQLVMQQPLAAFEKEYKVDVQHLHSGIYLVMIETVNQVVYSGKMVKE